MTNIETNLFKRTLLTFCLEAQTERFTMNHKTEIRKYPSNFDFVKLQVFRFTQVSQYFIGKGIFEFRFAMHFTISHFLGKAEKELSFDSVSSQKRNSSFSSFIHNFYFCYRANGQFLIYTVPNTKTISQPVCLRMLTAASCLTQKNALRAFSD